MLKDKIAIVTGGTRGIGYAIVEKYLANHAVVVLCGSRQETADKAVAALKAKDPSWRVEGIAPDLGSYASVKAAFDGVRERHGRIDAVGACAGYGVVERQPDGVGGGALGGHGHCRGRTGCQKGDSQC